MSLGTLHYNLLLLISGIVLLMQIAVKTHFHQPNSYYESTSALHAPPSNLALDHTDLFAELDPHHKLLIQSVCITLFALFILIRKTLSARDDPSPSRAPPECLTGLGSA